MYLRSIWSNVEKNSKRLYSMIISKLILIFFSWENCKQQAALDFTHSTDNLISLQWDLKDCMNTEKPLWTYWAIAYFVRKVELCVNSFQSTQSECNKTFWLKIYRQFSTWMIRKMPRFLSKRPTKLKLFYFSLKLHSILI